MADEGWRRLLRGHPLHRRRSRRVAIADNRLAELPATAPYDDDELVELLSYLDDDYEGTGWTAEDVEALITPPEDFGRER